MASTPQIYIKVVKAEGIRQHKGRDPTPSMLIRVKEAGEVPQVLKTKPTGPGTDASWWVLGCCRACAVTERGQPCQPGMCSH